MTWLSSVLKERLSSGTRGLVKPHPCASIKETATGTQVELPLEKYEAQVVVFDPGKKHSNPDQPRTVLSEVKTLPETDWQATFLPTMDNQWGDFRLPVTEHNQMIGVEARRFQWARGARAKDPAAQLRAPDAYAQSRRGTDS